MAKFKLVYQMHSGVRAPKRNRELFLTWLNSKPEFKKRKPTVEETVRAMRTGILRPLVKQDVHEAAKVYWRTEAQYWLRHVEVLKIEVTVSRKIARPAVRAYIPVSRTQYGRIPEHNYVTAQKALENQNLKHSIVERAMADLLAWKARYARYAEFFQVFSPVLEACKSVEAELHSTKPKQTRTRIAV